jgi:hypothetical protein
MRLSSEYNSRNIISEIDLRGVSASRIEQKVAELRVSMDIIKNSFLTNNIY